MAFILVTEKYIANWIAQIQLLKPKNKTPV